MHIQEDTKELEYKNLWLFYKKLYERLFNVINILIDEDKYNIIKIKDSLNSFLDDYSYYIIGKEIIESEEQLKKHVLIKITEFDEFTSTIKGYPSKQYIADRIVLAKQDFQINKIGTTKYIDIVKEYYEFFNEVILILKRFIDIASVNGFLPNLRSKKSLKTIGYAQYDTFFTNMEELKNKMSEETTNISVRNMLKVRRITYSVLVIFSPYFCNLKVMDELASKMDFSFIDDMDKMEFIKKLYSYSDLNKVGYNDQIKINEMINPLKRQVSLIKRYMSQELGDVGINAKIKKKYGFDPTGV